MTIAEIVAALEQFPDDTLLLTSLGQLYAEADELDRAEASFRQVLVLDPAYSVVYRYLGQTLVRRHRGTEALEMYQRGLKVAQDQGDLQTMKELQVFIKRLNASSA